MTISEHEFFSCATRKRNKEEKDDEEQDDDDDKEDSSLVDSRETLANKSRCAVNVCFLSSSFTYSRARRQKKKFEDMSVND